MTSHGTRCPKLNGPQHDIRSYSGDYIQVLSSLMPWIVAAVAAKPKTSTATQPGLQTLNCSAGRIPIVEFLLFPPPQTLRSSPKRIPPCLLETTPIPTLLRVYACIRDYTTPRYINCKLIRPLYTLLVFGGLHKVACACAEGTQTLHVETLNSESEIQSSAPYNPNPRVQAVLKKSRKPQLYSFNRCPQTSLVLPHSPAVAKG